MKGYRFYADLTGTENGPGKRATVAKLRAWPRPVNCIALITDDGPIGDRADALASIFDYEDSGVTITAVSRDYLRKCRRIPEWLARKLHPQMFYTLERINQS